MTKTFEPIVPASGVFGLSDNFASMRANLAARQEASNLQTAFGALTDLHDADSFGRIAASFPKHLAHISEVRSLESQLSTANKEIERLNKALAGAKAVADKYPAMKTRAERAEALAGEQQEAFETVLTLAKISPDQVYKWMEQAEKEATVSMTFVNQTIRQSRSATSSARKVRALTSKLSA